MRNGNEDFHAKFTTTEQSEIERRRRPQRGERRESKDMDDSEKRIEESLLFKNYPSL
jgi:hypothetical protein